MFKENSLLFHQDMKHGWGRREEYNVRCTSAKGNWIAWLKARVWKLREIRRGMGKVTFYVSVRIILERILLTSPGTRKRRSRFKSQIHQEVTCLKQYLKKGVYENT